MNRKSEFDRVPNSGRQWGRASGVRNTFFRGTLAVVLAVASASAVATVVEASGSDQSRDCVEASSTLVGFHEAKSVDDPVNGAMSAGEAEFCVASTDRSQKASRVDDPANGAMSAGEAEFYADRPGGSKLAVGGTPEGSAVAVTERSAPEVATSYSGDDAYDPAAGAVPRASVSTISQRTASVAPTSHSGDDDYDPAAGGSPERPVVSIARRSATADPTSLSGDDDYDAAAGGTPERSVVATSQRSASAAPTSYSGDDDYDPAAGGRPEMSLFAFARDLWLPFSV
ncbi:hypothetical protein ACFLWA_07085 [Chloroflexota bacterium]